MAGVTEVALRPSAEAEAVETAARRDKFSENKDRLSARNAVAAGGKCANLARRSVRIGAAIEAVEIERNGSGRSRSSIRHVPTAASSASK